jgi:Na+-driven multidrug efflux pump
MRCPSPRIRSHMAWAIATTLICSFPLGIVAVVHAFRVGADLRAGDLERARRSSRKALVWGWLSALVTVAAVALYLTLAIRGALTFGATSG